VLIVVVALVAPLVATALLLGTAHGRRRSSLPPRAFAGYEWRGHVSSVEASWTVPEIVLGSPCGGAATWIGAHAPGQTGPFIQVGTSEECLAPSTSIAGAHFDVPDTRYAAFWSDKARHFVGQELFPANAGDQVAASLTLARQRWTVAIVDTTTGGWARFTTPEEANASFNQAQWTQVDLTSTRTRRLGPYPRLTGVRFRDLKVDSAIPAYADLYSTWISVDGTHVAPSPLYNDSFTLQHATLSAAGVQYDDIVQVEQEASERFDRELVRWTSRTGRSQIVSACLRFAAPLRAAIHALVHTPWSSRVRGLVSLLALRMRVLLDDTQAPAASSWKGLAAWRSTWWRHEERAISATDLVERALNLPQL
jgi:hypothetical protein